MDDSHPYSDLPEFYWEVIDASLDWLKGADAFLSLYIRLSIPRLLALVQHRR